jgi:hypothetical protein
VRAVGGFLAAFRRSVTPVTHAKSKGYRDEPSTRAENRGVDDDLGASPAELLIADAQRGSGSVCVSANPNAERNTMRFSSPGSPCSSRLRDRDQGEDHQPLLSLAHAAAELQPRPEPGHTAGSDPARVALLRQQQRVVQRSLRAMRGCR